MKRISEMATKSTHTDFEVITTSLVTNKCEASKSNHRLREIHMFHEGDSDTLHRMLNAIQPKSYIIPHRHKAVPKAESVIVIKGSIAFIAFNDNGDVLEQSIQYLKAGSECFGIDYRAGVWHTFIALTEDTVLFEVKPGPYDSATDKEFAPWAPKENSPEALVYLAELEDLIRSKYHLEKRNWKN